MSSNNYESCIKVAACICARDGIISEVEERAIYDKLKEKYPDVNVDMFEDVITDFFNSEEQIEDYLEQITEKELREFTLELAETSAGADGLDIRENIALQKACSIWDLSLHA